MNHGLAGRYADLNFWVLIFEAIYYTAGLASWTVWRTRILALCGDLSGRELCLIHELSDFHDRNIEKAYLL